MFVADKLIQSNFIHIQLVKKKYLNASILRLYFCFFQMPYMDAFYYMIGSSGSRGQHNYRLDLTWDVVRIVTQEVFKNLIRF